MSKETWRHRVNTRFVILRIQQSGLLLRSANRDKERDNLTYDALEIWTHNLPVYRITIHEGVKIYDVIQPAALAKGGSFSSGTIHRMTSSTATPIKSPLYVTIVGMNAALFDEMLLFIEILCLDWRVRMTFKNVETVLSNGEIFFFCYHLIRYLTQAAMNTRTSVYIFLAILPILFTAKHW